MFLEVANSFGIKDGRALELTSLMTVKSSREVIECTCCFRINYERYIDCLIKYSLDYDLAAEREFLMFHFGRTQATFQQIIQSAVYNIPGFLIEPEQIVADLYAAKVRSLLIDPSKYN